MLRHPLSSAVGRTAGADISRVTDGITASLRNFSVARKLQQDNSNDGDNNDDYSLPLMGKQRAAAAFDELMSISDMPTNSDSSSASPSSPAASPDTDKPTQTPIRPAALASLTRGPRIIKVSSLPSRDGVRIIRGGFRGPGGAGPPAGGRRPSIPGMTGDLYRQPQRFAGRGGGGGGGGGGGRGGRRGRGRRREGGDGDRRRGGRDDGRQGDPEDVEDPAVQAWREEKEMGALVPYNPSVSLSVLAGYGPAVATSTTPFAAAETATRQARILGGGDAYHEGHLLEPQDAQARFRDGEGVFFPTPRARKLARRNSPSTLGWIGLPPEETRTAVLEAALLGHYDGPRFAEPGDTAGAVRSYVRRDGTWNADASRRIEAKIMSLLPDGWQGAPASTRAASARPSR
ncbi:hypothetical protein F5X99DRAFT_425271 [Biscogniauxia marginata]|nr:hypothetical protein F5X99DRAFT_425271 [Biscogniauxia marginata]